MTVTRTTPPASTKPASTAQLLIVIAVLLLCGFAAGLMTPVNSLRSLLFGPPAAAIDAVDAHADESADAHAGHDHGPAETGVFDVSIAAQKTYGVAFAKVELGNFTQTISVPASVRERPTVSNLQASSRLEGVVRRIFVQVGQSVREGDALVELELTGNELASAQSGLLESVERLQILQREITRLEPAAQDGGIAKKSLIEKQYQLQELNSDIGVKRQELLVRGLSAEDVTSIVDQKRLVRSVMIRVPTGLRPQNVQENTRLHAVNQRRFRLASSSTDVSEPATSDEWVYSVESMNVSPGSVMTMGQPVCDLAYHETLLIEGQAYERDVATLTKILEDQSSVSISLGEVASPVFIDDLKVLYMDNHVDAKTQTYRFFIEVPNRVVSQNISPTGERFRSWQFKPGQRAHVRLPQKVWSNRLILPAAAVSENGVDHIIFQQVAVHDHFHGDEPPHSEFKKIVVKLEYKDQHTAVVDHLEQLKARHVIATNNADMLFRAMNAGSVGGGHSHDHGHEH